MPRRPLPLRLSGAALALLASLGGCGSDRPAQPTGPTTTGPGRAAAKTPRATPRAPDPLDDPEPGTTPTTPTTPTAPIAPTAPAALAPLPAPSATGTPPARGCIATAEPVLVWAHEGPAAIAAHGHAFVVAGISSSASGAEELFVVRVAPGEPPAPIGTLALVTAGLEERIAPPAITAVDATDVAVALVDAGRTLRSGRVSVSPPAGRVELAELASGADNRMAPALRAVGRRVAVAYTDGSGTPMRVKLVLLDAGGHHDPARDLTPPSMGASAPTFVDGLTTPTLVFVDARDAISPIVRVTLSSDGVPSPGQVVVPVGVVSTPPELAAAFAPSGAWVGYTVVGHLASTAVGLVRLDRNSEAPTALVPGTAYSPLHVAAVATPDAVVFAADAPTGPGREPPHEIHVRRVDAEGAGPVLVLRAPDGTAAHAAIARRADGTVAVAFSAASGVYVQTARCQ